MKVTQKEKYMIIEDDLDDIAEFATNITKNHSKFEKENVVLNLLNMPDLNEKDLLLFMELSNLHRLQKKSFVIVGKGVSIDVIPEELFVVPTLQEAEDIINMEEVERELGF